MGREYVSKPGGPAHGCGDRVQGAGSGPRRVRLLTVMKLLNVTLETAEGNLALDEALLLTMDREPHSEEMLRVWEPSTMHVVLGRASKVEQEVNASECVADAVPLFRRTTGGATILAGPGCLFYSVVLNRTRHPDLKGLEQIHQFVLNRVAQGLGTRIADIRREGTSDLTLPGEEGGPRKKFSGNSLRVRREALLYHGTILCDFPLASISRYLRTPPRQPDYRAGRDHQHFVANLGGNRSDLMRAIQEGFPIDGTVVSYPRSLVEELVETKYRRDDWNLKL